MLGAVPLREGSVVSAAVIQPICHLRHRSRGRSLFSLVADARYVSSITRQQFEMLLPLACAWAAGQERAILQSGVALTESQLADARRVGVAQPESVRLLRVVQIPTPAHPALAAAARATNLISPLTGGLTLRYGIFVRAVCWGQRPLIVHEFVHTLQYERLGGFDGFLRPYLLECITPPGYPYGPMEQEAIITAARLCA